MREHSQIWGGGKEREKGNTRSGSNVPSKIIQRHHKGPGRRVPKFIQGEQSSKWHSTHVRLKNVNALQKKRGKRGGRLESCFMRRSSESIVVEGTKKGGHVKQSNGPRRKGKNAKKPRII